MTYSASDVFANAEVQSWLADVEDTTDDTLLEEAIEVVLVSDSGVSAAEAACALAALEFIAAAAGASSAAFEELDWAQSWLRRVRLSPEQDLLDRCALVLERVADEDSELAAYFERKGLTEEWTETLDDLEARLSSI